MKETKVSLQTRLYLVSVSILLAGLGCAAWIYLQAENDSVTAVMDGVENSKSYVDDLELYGGKANLLANEIRSWFEGLWHGKALASTVAFITLFVSLVLSGIGYLLPGGLPAEVRSEVDDAK